MGSRAAGGPKRVLLLYTLVGRGADAIQVLAMSRALGRLGYQVRLLGPHRIQPYVFSGFAVRSREPVKRLPWWTRDLVVVVLNVAVAVWACFVALRFRPDYILERATAYGPAGIWVARLFRVPLVTHFDAPVGEERAAVGDGLAGGLHRRLVRGIGRHARVVVVGSQVSWAYYAGLGIPQERLVLMQNGVFEEEIAAQPRRRDGSPVAGFVGSMAGWHRVDLLIDAVGQLRRSGCPLRVLLVGMGRDYRRLADLVTARGLADAVKFAGPVSHAEALAFIDSFTVAVLPHTLATGAPIKLFEYAARGAPIVAPDLPNLRQIWGDEAVAYFRPGDAGDLARTLGRLVRSATERARLAATARRIVREKYTWEKQMGHVIEALTQSAERDGKAVSA